jgi:hypothetical protein
VLPLVAIATSIVPTLIGLIAGDRAGQVAAQAAKAVQVITGTDDPVKAKETLAANSQLQVELQTKLANIALERQRLENEELAAKRASDIEDLKQRVTDRVSARSSMVELVSRSSLLAWGAAAVSIMISTAFFAFVWILLTRGLATSDPNTLSIANLVVGVLTASFATMTQFWLGSSQSSRTKDAFILDQKKPVPAPQPPPVVLQPISEPEPEPPVYIPPAGPTRPAPPGLLADVLPSLIVTHRYFKDAVSWQLTPDGISIDGVEARGTPGLPQTVNAIWARYGDLIAGAARRYGCPAELIVATIATESGGDPAASRPESGNRESVGLMQTLVRTARDALGRPDLTREELLDPATSILAGVAYIVKQRGSSHFDAPLVAASYNAGSLRRDDASENRWRLYCYPPGTGQHIDRYVAWFNDCMRADLVHDAGVPSFAQCMKR